MIYIRKAILLISVLMPMPSITHSKIQTPTKQLDCLTTNIYHESKGESYKGKLAVAFVTINRTKSSKFPDNICAVVYQQSQFSWVNKKKKSITDPDLFDDIKEIAQLVITKYDELDDPTNGSLYFHSTKINPKWNKTKTVKIGGHVFYK